MDSLVIARGGIEDHSFRPSRTFALARRAWVAFALAVLLGVLTAWAGRYEAPVPTASGDGDATLPMWRLLTMGVGTLPALGLHSALRGLEEVGTDVHRRAERRYLLCLSLACAGAYLAVAASALDLPVAGIILRSLPGWLGLALVSGRFLGWRLAWVLPAGALCVLVYWGSTGDGGHHEWWEFSARPHDDVPSLLLSLCLLLGGVTAASATSWRAARLTGGRA
ncbi:hypothetical protein [Streptosporangium sp. NPDC002524]|uniref:hypothetical protein n=1 Tax=Streptosporangium sp. NPDC002524 TaxID=3154537 RepID=UPI0033306EE8